MHCSWFVAAKEDRTLENGPNWSRRKSICNAIIVCIRQRMWTNQVNVNHICSLCHTHTFNLNIFGIRWCRYRPSCITFWFTLSECFDSRCTTKLHFPLENCPRFIIRLWAAPFVSVVSHSRLPICSNKS